jgi:hypothetical protein
MSRADEIKARVGAVSHLHFTARWNEGVGGWIGCDPTPTLEEERAVVNLAAHAPADLAWLLEERERLRAALRDTLLFVPHRPTCERLEDGTDRCVPGCADRLARVALGEEPTP